MRFVASCALDADFVFALRHRSNLETFQLSSLAIPTSNLYTRLLRHISFPSGSSLMWCFSSTSSTASPSNRHFPRHVTSLTRFQSRHFSILSLSHIVFRLHYLLWQHPNITVRSQVVRRSQHGALCLRVPRQPLLRPRHLGDSVRRSGETDCILKGAFFERRVRLVKLFTDMSYFALFTLIVPSRTTPLVPMLFSNCTNRNRSRISSAVEVPSFST